MNSSIFNPLWLAALQASAQQPPRTPRQDLWLNGQRIGSVEPNSLMAIMPNGLSLRTGTFVLERRDTDAGWHITGQGTPALAHIAQALRAGNLGFVREQWRDEQLAVVNDANQQVATVERGVARWLGIATHAVHFLGHTGDGRVWVQQRALDKAIDPGLWDTMVGGMVPASDNLTTALRRETWEEAGIDFNRVMRLHAGGRLQVARPNAKDGGVGYVVEHIDWFMGLIPDDVTPINQDGEVAQFALLNWTELMSQLEANAFTLDAALIFSAAHARPLPKA
ncbi:NUDIX domain-containing protein [Rhodoferax sp.]|uniref:NUDIX domain-containing protein n=1 Tax=Rhodoferax sp. TaxID=50421 RepID=UPI00284805FF|nr:NUDIX domain-containing protein [Rhodoferax sp.]MDR3369876.1 NUDIX domain-containing protein [Rhodoferax sp.]